MNKTGPLVIVSIRPQWPAGATGGTGFGQGVRLDFCGSTGFGWRSICMSSWFLFS